MIRTPYCLIALWVAMTGFPGTARTQPVSDAGAPAPASASDLFDKSLEDLLNMKVDVATRTAVDIDAAPSIVSVVSHRDIENYGYRTLQEILHSIPGFEFGIDVTGQQGPTVRGVWGDEGKVLVLLNGLILTELGWGGSFGMMMMPTDFIERVEVIRGPGSALYGQFAEVAVINVVSRRGADLNGIRLSGGLTTQTINNSGYRFDASGGGKVGDIEFAMSVGSSLDPVSSRTYHDFFGNQLKMGLTNTGTAYDYIVASTAYRGLSINYRRQTLVLRAPDDFGPIVFPTAGIVTETEDPAIDGGSVTYKFNPTTALSVELKAELVRTSYGAHSYYPGSSFATLNVIGSPTPQGLQNAISTDLFIYQAVLDYDFDLYGVLTLGGGYRRENVKNVSNGNLPALYFGPDLTDTGISHNLDTSYVLAQYAATIQDLGLSITAGARAEFTPFGGAVAPRGGLTWGGSGFTAKLLYGHAYRIPTGIQAYSQIYARPGTTKLVPENVDSYEVEIGYRLAEGVRIRANGFYIDVDRPLLYNGNTSSYSNKSHIRSTGFEVDAQWNHLNYGAYANLSFAKPVSGTFDQYVTADGRDFVGYAPIKVNLGGFYRYGVFEIGPSIVIESAKQGQSSAFANGLTNGTLENRSYPAIALLNVNVRATNVFQSRAANIDFYFIAANLANASYELVQGYYGGHAPYPALDRQFLLGGVWHYGMEEQRAASNADAT